MGKILLKSTNLEVKVVQYWAQASQLGLTEGTSIDSGLAGKAEFLGDRMNLSPVSQGLSISQPLASFSFPRTSQSLSPLVSKYADI